MIPSQMLKGTLSGCILAIISRKETYGYEIAEKLSGYGFGKIAEGTIYRNCFAAAHRSGVGSGGSARLAQELRARHSGGFHIVLADDEYCLLKHLRIGRFYDDHAPYAARPRGA